MDNRRPMPLSAKILLGAILLLILLVFFWLVKPEETTTNLNEMDNMPAAQDNGTTSPDPVKESGPPSGDTTPSPSGTGPGPDGDILSQPN
jgi:hypothetical protein